VAGTCCGDEGILTPAGFCCSSINVTDPVTNATRRSHPRLDRNGTCCASGRLNACGVCDGVRTAVVAASGECCVGGVLDAGGLCCVSGVLDAFGVCDGTDSTGTQVRGLALVAVLCPFPSRDCVWQRGSVKIRVRCVWSLALVLTGAPFPPSWQPLFMLLDSVSDILSPSQRNALFTIDFTRLLAHSCVFLCVAVFCTQLCLLMCRRLCVCRCWM
jgi:hypothetical protein